MKEWSATTLGQIITLEYGRALKADLRNVSGSVPVAGSNGTDGWHTDALVMAPGIVVGRKGSAGKVTWFDVPFWPIDTTYYVKPKIQVELRWVYYLLLHLELGKLSLVTGVPGLNREDAYRRQCLLPSISEQRRIVEILDQADALRKLRTEADAKAEQIVPAVFYQMFGDPTISPKGLSFAPISDMVCRIDRRDPSQQPDSPFVYIDIAGVDGKTGSIVETRTMLGSEAPSRARQIVRMNDVIVSTVRPYLRATALVPSELDMQICSTGFCVLRAKHTFGWGYLYVLSRLQWFTDALNNMARGASYPAVTDRDILNLTVPYAEDRDRLEALDRQLATLIVAQKCRMKSQKSIDTLFYTLLSRAFSGELTAEWREAHMKELLREMELQEQALRAVNA